LDHGPDDDQQGGEPREAGPPTAPMTAGDEGERLAPAPPVRSEGPRRLLRHVVVDVGPLRRHRDFRLLWTGQAISLLGSEFTYVAVPYQAYQLSRSSLVVGLLSAAELVPLLVMALLGGAFADAVDRRRLVLLAELLSAGASAALLVNALLPRPHLWVLFVVSALMAGLSGLQRPPLDALLPRLVEHDELPAAGALSALGGTVGSIAGPALAGVLIAAAGVEGAYALDIATFGAAVVALALMHAVPPPADAEKPSLRGIAKGLRYAAGRQELLGTYGVDIIAMFFGMPLALFPALAQRFGGASALGLLYSAPSVGSLVATLTSGWVTRIHRHGVAVCLAAAGWGAGIVLLGFAPSLALALAALVVAGFCDMISGIFRMVIWNQTIPDRLRGRLAGIEQISYSTGPLLGNVESGLVASLTGVRVAIASGGVLCVAGVAVAAAVLRGFWRYDARTAPRPQ
jgi:MFS family permease